MKESLLVKRCDWRLFTIGKRALIGYEPTWLFQEYIYTGPLGFMWAMGTGVLGATPWWVFIVFFRFSEGLFSKVKRFMLKQPQVASSWEP